MLSRVLLWALFARPASTHYRRLRGLNNDTFVLLMLETGSPRPKPAGLFLPGSSSLAFRWLSPCHATCSCSLRGFPWGPVPQGHQYYWFRATRCQSLLTQPTILSLAPVNHTPEVVGKSWKQPVKQVSQVQLQHFPQRKERTRVQMFGWGCHPC